MAPAPSAETQDPPTVTGPRPGGVLRIALNAEPDNIDPHLLIQTESMRVMEQIYSSLMRLDPQLNIKPDLATEWSISPDGTVYTFTLRKGVKFHNGREFTAEDVKYSIERMADPQVGSPWSYLFVDLDHVRVIDQYQVQIVMTQPSAQILAALASPLMAIVPREVVQQHGNLKTVGVGTGPFKLAEWVPGQRIRLAKNLDYHSPGLPYLDAVEFVFVDDPSTRVQQVLSGTLDVDIDVPLAHYESYKNAPGMKVVGGEVVSFFYLGVNTARKPFDDARIRQAMAWALDRDEVVKLAADGHGAPLLGGALPSNHWAYAGLVVYPRPDVEKAKALLAEAGATGLKLELMTRAGEQGIAQVVQQQLNRAGFDAKITLVESGAFTRRVWSEQDFDVVVSRWGTMIDPDDFLYGQFVTGGGWNPYGFGDSRVDDLLNAGRRTLDQEQRKTIYRDAEKLIAEAAPYVFLYRPVRYGAMRTTIQGLEHEAANTRLSLRETWIQGN